MSLIPLFNGRRSHAQNPYYSLTTTTITHQSQINQGRQNPYDPSITTIARPSQISWGRHDLYNPSTTTTKHQGRDWEDPYNDPARTTITSPSQISQGRQDDPSHQFYLQTRRSLIAPALSFHNEPTSLAQIEYEGTPETHIFRAHLHGYKKEDVKVQVEDGRTLKITGEKKIVEKQYDNWHHFQRRIGKFLTAFDLPMDARADKVKSSMEKNGVLTITVPKKGAKKSHVTTVRIMG